MMIYRISFILMIALIFIGCEKQSTPKDVNAETEKDGNDAKMNDPKSECEALMSAVLPFAEELLSKHREFFPFGGTMSMDGTITHSAGWTGDEHPTSVEVIELLEKDFIAGAASSEYKATAIVSDIRTIPPGRDKKQDAIAVGLDHRDNYSVIVIFPYTLSSDGKLNLEQSFAMKGENKIFQK